MKYALNLAQDGRVLSVTYPEFAPGDAITTETLPEGNVADYRYVDGAFVYEPIVLPEVETAPTDTERITELEEALAMLLEGVTE